MAGEKWTKAIKILEGRAMAHHLDWLSSFEGHRAIFHVPGITKAHQSSNRAVFSYDGKFYELLHENLDFFTFPDGERHFTGTFRLLVDHKEVLVTGFVQWRTWIEFVGMEKENCIRIDSFNTKKIVLRDWVDAIPELCAKAKKIRDDPRQRDAQRWEEERDKELDGKVDLGDFE